MLDCIHKTSSPQGEGQAGAKRRKCRRGGEEEGEGRNHFRNESSKRSWKGERKSSSEPGDISFDPDGVNHLRSANDLSASRALPAGKGVPVGGVKALKSEKTEHKQLSHECGAEHAGFLERWRLPSRSHGHFRRLTKILVTITQTATRGSRC